MEYGVCGPGWRRRMFQMPQARAENRIQFPVLVKLKNRLNCEATACYFSPLWGQVAKFSLLRASESRMNYELYSEGYEQLIGYPLLIKYKGRLLHTSKIFVVFSFTTI